MNVTKDNASTALLTDTVSNFSVALATTQETLCTNNATITAMQIQPQMICQTLGSQPLPGMVSYYTSNRHPVDDVATNKAATSTAVVAMVAAATCAATAMATAMAVAPMVMAEATVLEIGATHQPTCAHNPPNSIKRSDNWNFCHTHGSDQRRCDMLQQLHDILLPAL